MPTLRTTHVANGRQDQFHIKFEACPACYGTYFDAGEFRDLKEHTVLERFSQMLHTLSTNAKQE